MRLILMVLQIGDFRQFVPSAQISNLLKCPISIYLCDWKGAQRYYITVGSVVDHVWSTVVYTKWTNRTLAFPVPTVTAFDQMSINALETMKTEYLTSFSFLCIF